MKKILIISPYFPYPARDGGKVRLYNLIKHLSLQNEVYLLAYIENTTDKESIESAGKVCKGVFPVLRQEEKRIIQDDIPRSVSYFYTQAMIDELEKVMQTVKPDIVQIDFLIMTRYVYHINNTPVFYTEHDMSILDFKQSFHDRDLSEDLRFVEWQRLVEYERKIINKFKSVIVLTHRDKKLMDGFSGKTESVIIPTGVDTDFFKPEEIPSEEQAEQNLVFVGHYRHYPNADAIIYFVNEIYEKVLNILPKIKLYVVGSGLTKDIEKLSHFNSNIIVTGEVEDIRKYLNRPNIFVAPVRLGGGIKGKVLEAMSQGLAVVATKEAVDGIDYDISGSVLVSDDSDVFADNIVQLANDKNLYDRISKNARIIVEKHYNWKMIAETLNNFYDLKLIKK